MTDARDTTVGLNDQASSRRALLDNVRFGVGRGLRLAVGFAAISTVSGLLGLGLGRPTANPFVSLHITYIVGLECHLIAGLVAGAIGGVMRPLSRWLGGALLIGAVAGAITAIVFSVGEYGRNFWNPDARGIDLVFACIGAGMAAYIRHVGRSRRGPGHASS